MRSQDFVQGKKSNYFLLKSIEEPMSKTATLDNLPELNAGKVLVEV